MAFHLTTTAFQNGEFIPREFTCDGPDNLPVLAWTEPPAGTKSLAVIADDPDTPAGTWVHWVLYDLPGDAPKLEEGVAQDRQLPNGARHERPYPRRGQGGRAVPALVGRRTTISGMKRNSSMNCIFTVNKGCES